VRHEETRATASQATAFPNGHYLVVRDHDEAAIACDFIRHGGDADAFVARFGEALSPGFDPARDLAHVGCANQTTMLMTESLEIGEMFRQAMLDRYGAAELPARFRAFDTICSATQERQDAVIALLDAHQLTMAVVIGGYNSSNTCNLARICAERVPTYHIADPAGLLSAAEIRHRPIGAPSTAAVAEVVTSGWLPEGPVVLGLTAGASTPNNIVGQVIERLEVLAIERPGT
jgi:4-hydroxy-3-methylbut-2-enyl diphosphate reductase